MSETVLRLAEGGAIPLHLERWQAPPDDHEWGVLEQAIAPVLDVGCGPGRHVLALGRSGVVSLGVDASPAAVRLARRRGAPVLERSVFGRLPLSGRWGTALLLDGNIGIGGDPVTLLLRLRALLHATGRVLAEVEPPGVATRVVRACVEGSGQRGPWFPWGLVGADDIATIAADAGFTTADVWEAGGRWFTRLERCAIHLAADEQAFA